MVLEEQIEYTVNKHNFKMLTGSTAKMVRQNSFVGNYRQPFPAISDS